MTDSMIYPQPVSGAPAVPPQESPQHTTMQLPVLPPPPAGGPRTPWIPVLASATALFFLLAAVMTALYIAKVDEQNDTRQLSGSQVQERERTIADKNREIDDLKRELADARKRADDGDDKNKDLGDQNKKILDCLKLVFEMLDAMGRNDLPVVQQKLQELAAPCHEARQFVN